MFTNGRSGRELDAAERLNWLRLIRTENVGPVNFRRLINRFGSVAAAIEALPRFSQQGGKTISVYAQGRAERELEALERMGARLVCIGEPDYPQLLKHIPAPPPAISLMGQPQRDLSRALSIVGARNASAAGQRLTGQFAADLADAGYYIVSGLARGIDAAAHKAALSTGTVAVLAGGLDRIYPSENIPLAREIVDQGGVLISEMPLGWEPRARDFPRRNRLVAGLGLGTLVVEAAKRSGSLITARMALEQNREVFAIPGSPLDPRAEGANALIRQGATLVTAATDIIEALRHADPAKTMLFDEEEMEAAAFTPEMADLEACADDRTRVVSALSFTPVSIDDLVGALGLATPIVQTVLLELDLAGRLEWGGAQLVSLKP